ncbi:MAG: hypothetical protein AAGF74_04395 [Pseudomonadota bacterium]
MKRVFCLLLFALAACGVDGPPLPPEGAVPEVQASGIGLVPENAEF